MSLNESRGIQSSDVESLLKQMKLRGPSDQLDIAISNLVVPQELKELSAASGVRFGWTAILATAAAAMLAGIWMGYSVAPIKEETSGSDVVTVDSNSPDSILTPVAFNVKAFNLLHGHSQLEEFENCNQCHQLEIEEDATLSEFFQGWFYGDEHFFESHPNQLVVECSKCHVAATAEKEEFAKLMNCSDCHIVDAEGFDGFKRDWRTAAPISDG
jgi:hypothetical protein